MFTLENFDKYLHEQRIIIYEQDGSVNRVAWAVLLPCGMMHGSSVAENQRHRRRLN